MNALQQFFTADYLFDPSPYDQQFVLGRPLVALLTIVLIIAFSILIRALFPRMKRRALLRGRAFTLIGFGLVGYMLLWFRYERTEYLSMRAILLAYFLLFAAYLARIAWKAVQERAT